MANVRYVTSRGVSFDLLSFSSAKLQSADFHKYSWNKEVIPQQYGEVLNRFTKEAKILPCTFKFKGSRQYRADLIERLHFETEYDITHEQIGRLYWGNSYIDCYMITSDTYPQDDGMVYTINDVEFYCPYPFWIQEQKIEIFASGTTGDDPTAKGYTATKYGYPYSYSGGSTTTYIDTHHFSPSWFKAIAYGPAPSVEFSVDNHLYRVNYPLRQRQYMVIDSRQSAPIGRQAYVVTEAGDIINVFDYRDTSSDLFKKFPSGHFILNYPRTYGLDLTIYRERSEPI